MKRTMTSNLLPGMVLAENVYTYNNDQLILPKGAVLDDKSIAKLEFYSTVNVLVEDEIEEVVIEDIRERKFDDARICLRDLIHKAQRENEQQRKQYTDGFFHVPHPFPCIRFFYPVHYIGFLHRYKNFVSVQI